MDVVMPGVNGFQATRTLAHDPRHARRSRSIMVTSQGPGDRPHLGHAPGRGRLHGEAGVAGQARREGAGRAGRLTVLDRDADEPATLRSLRDRPFELLRELERRGRAVIAAGAGPRLRLRARMGRRGVPHGARAVSGRARGDARSARRSAGVTRVPGAKPGSRHRQRARPAAAGGRPACVPRRRRDAKRSRNARVIVVNHREVPAGCWSTKCSASAASPNANSPRRAADDGALRALSRGRVPARHRKLAGIQPADAAREPGSSCTARHDDQGRKDPQAWSKIARTETPLARCDCRRC